MSRRNGVAGLGQINRRTLVGGMMASSSALWFGRNAISSLAASPAASISRGPLDKPVVALTFDGGSDRGHSVHILDTLASNGIKATFPLTGHFAVANSDIVRRIVNEGHQLVNHSWSHPSFTGASNSTSVLSTAARVQQLEECETALVNAGGVGGKPYFRPPFGDYDHSVLQVLGNAGFSTCLLWSVDVLGWTGISQSQIVSRVVANHGNGYIYLMHVGGESQEGPALQSIITRLRNFGYGFATAASLLSGTADPVPPLFAIGNMVRVTSALYLRSEPNLTGRVMATMPTGTPGSVVGGPSPADGYTWYQVQTTFGTGWAATVGLIKTVSNPPPVSQPKFKVGDAVRVTSGLYLRSAPTLNSTVFLTMPTGTTGSILAGPSPANGYTWYQILTALGTGWAAAEHMEKTSPTPPPAPTPPPGSYQAGESVKVTAGLYLRSSASLSSTVYITMSTGTVCTIQDGPVPANGYTWYKVSTPNGVGWAAGEFLARTSGQQPPPSGDWIAGDRVRTTESLRLRSTASSSGSIKATMAEGTVCTVVSGPKVANGYSWYEVLSSYGRGWAAKAYLVKI